MSAIDKIPVFPLSISFENGEKIKWTLYDERSDNFPYEKIWDKISLKIIFRLKKNIFFARRQATTLTLPAAFLSTSFLWYGIAHTGEIFDFLGE